MMFTTYFQMVQQKIIYICIYNVLYIHKEERIECGKILIITNLGERYTGFIVLFFQLLCSFVKLHNKKIGRMYLYTSLEILYKDTYYLFIVEYSTAYICILCTCFLKIHIFCFALMAPSKEHSRDQCMTSRGRVHLRNHLCGFTCNPANREFYGRVLSASPAVPLYCSPCCGVASCGKCCLQHFSWLLVLSSTAS